MKAFIEDLNHRADELAEMVVRQRVGQTFVIGGRWGSGKSSLLQALKPRLADQGLFPVVVAPPPRDMDTGAVALVQIGESLQQHALLNGELATLENPQRRWPEKLSATLGWVEQNKGAVVLLCEEVDKWTVPPTADESFSPYSNRHVQDVVDAIHGRVHCRRVLTSSSAQTANGYYRYDLPKDTHPSWLLEAADTWGSDLEPLARELHKRLGANLGVATPLEIRLLVALAAVTSVREVAVYYSTQWPECHALVRQLASRMETRSEFSRLRTLWSQLARCRESMEQELLDSLGARSLQPQEQAVLYHGLLYQRENRYELNRVLRLNDSVISWLSREQRVETHRQLAEYYAAKIESNGPAYRGRQLEAFHHASQAGDPDTLQRFHALFPAQLNKLGRTLSKEARNFAAAADVFRLAIQWDDQNDYAHHYLAYNVDWLANDPGLAEAEYRRALEVNPEHPWWWSRWINFLITLGRAREARVEWARAVDALNLTGGEGPETVYQSLHLSVARLLIHRAQLDFADTVLNETPASLRKNDLRFGALENLLAALREAERARSVFPLTVPFNEWWTDKPHLDFSQKQSIVKWFPAQVDAVDGDTIRLVMGKRAADGQRAEYAHVDLPRSKFDAASLDEPSGELEPGRFLELAFYGAEETLKIRSHPDLPWQSPDLPPIDPDPRRYLRKAGIAR
jgi:tetratricopeptide (TPR) repeat protein